MKYLHFSAAANHTYFCGCDVCTDRKRRAQQRDIWMLRDRIKTLENQIAEAKRVLASLEDTSSL